MRTVKHFRQVDTTDNTLKKRGSTMRLIGCGDIHMTPGNLAKIDTIKDADLLIVNGDLTNYGKQGDAKAVLDQIMAVIPWLKAQVGNLDHFEINDYLESLDINLHAQATIFKGAVCLVGLGGSNPTPFKTPTEFSENELKSFARQGFSQAKELLGLAEQLHNHHIPTIFISHTPPINTSVDKIGSGVHVGSAAVREAIEQYQPDLCLCGHIHEAAGMDTIGKTPIFNPGMVSKGGYIDIHIDHSTVTATLQSVYK